MKKIIYAILALGIISLPSCSDDDDKLPNVKPTERGTVTDNDGNVYEWVRIGDQDWTTTNALNGSDMIDHEYFDNFNYSMTFSSKSSRAYVTDTYHPAFGNLMSYEDAVASAPEGWRLPSDEDWMKLEKTLGIDNPDRKGWRGNNGVGLKAQGKDNGCCLNLLLGGNCAWLADLGYSNQDLLWVDEFGFYWTSTVEPAYVEMEADHEMAYFRKIAVGMKGIGRECTRTDNLLSVRWVRDAK